ncbi:hypothetical protein [Priestia aryabhattai]|uniref:hypothetical protein n=1 Tax=Priestia aryabhattai TaxID=412384 RepID=UPI002E1FD2ED|nr:hypothetical protein [Priestia aryabhattai]
MTSYLICSYCETENKAQDNMQQCIFCGAPIESNQSRPKLKEFVMLEDCERPFLELSNFHIYDLLILLRLIRRERSKSFDLMRTLKKVSDSPEINQDMVSYSEEQYSYYTKRMKVIEGIIIDRMGYKPKRVDDKLLASLRYKIDEVNKKEYQVNA